MKLRDLLTKKIVKFLAENEKDNLLIGFFFAYLVLTKSSFWGRRK